jgi:hypothetical protein
LAFPFQEHSISVTPRYVPDESDSSSQSPPQKTKVKNRKVNLLFRSAPCPLPLTPPPLHTLPPSALACVRLRPTPPSLSVKKCNNEEPRVALRRSNRRCNAQRRRESRAAAAGAGAAGAATSQHQTPGINKRTVLPEFKQLCPRGNLPSPPSLSLAVRHPMGGKVCLDLLFILTKQTLISN